MREQLAAVPRDRERERHLGAVRLEVLEGHAISAGVERGDDALGDRARIERIGTAPANCGQRLAELAVAEDLAGMRQSAGEKDRGCAGVAAEQRLVQRDVVRDDVGEDDAVARVLLGRREQLVETARPVRRRDVFPRPHRARHADAERPALGQRTVREIVERGTVRRAAAAVVRDGAARVRVAHDAARVVHDPERIAADAAARRVRHRKHRVRRDRRVHCVPAAAQHVDAGRRRERVRRGDHRARRAGHRAARPARGAHRHAAAAAGSTTIRGSSAETGRVVIRCRFCTRTGFPGATARRLPG